MNIPHIRTVIHELAC